MRALAAFDLHSVIFWRLVVPAVRSNKAATSIRNSFAEGETMKSRRVFVSSIFAIIVLICISGLARVDRPYHNGSVWELSFIRVKPGMDEAYTNYLAGQWKQQQEAMKLAGIILSYKVIG